MNWEEKYNAIAELVDGYRRERDEARDDFAFAMRKMDEQIAIIADTAKERDEARREADRFRHGCTVEGDFVCPNEYVVSELTAERNFLRALKKNHEEDFTRVCKERDEARAEVGRLRAEAAPMNEHFNAGYRDGARDAYRRGAEAMREACAEACRPMLRSMASRSELADAMRALPIPEEP